MTLQVLQEQHQPYRWSSVSIGKWFQGRVFIKGSRSIRPHDSNYSCLFIQIG